MHKIYDMEFLKIYDAYIKKIERKGQKREDLDKIIKYLTGYEDINILVQNKTTLREFFENAPNLNPKRTQIRGVICGVRIEEIKDILMREIRYMDKLVDDLSKGKSIEKILI